VAEPTTPGRPHNGRIASKPVSAWPTRRLDHDRLSEHITPPGAVNGIEACQGRRWDEGPATLCSTGPVGGHPDVIQIQARTTAPRAACYDPSFQGAEIGRSISLEPRLGRRGRATPGGLV